MSPHAKPFVCETATTRALHFDIAETQSCMLIGDPDALALEYTRTMMGFLLFNPEPRQITMIGLGGGSPVEAGAAQILVTFGILASQFLTVTVAARLIASARLLPADLRDRLRP